MQTGEWPQSWPQAGADDEPLALLALEDGAVFAGHPFGCIEALRDGRRGEVIFNTSMTGYQEICTDPSYRGQMVVMTFPLIGNYGVTQDDAESRRPWLSALLVREYCEEHSNWRATASLHQYLARHGIPGVSGLDTRALTRHLRSHGTLRGVLRAYPAGGAPARDEMRKEIDTLVSEAQLVCSVSELGVVADVSHPKVQWWLDHPCGSRHEQGTKDVGPVALHYVTGSGSLLAGGGQGGKSSRVVVIDAGYKQSIARRLEERGLEVVLAPHTITRQQLQGLRPDGVVLSNGPGDPQSVAHLVELTRYLLAERLPLLGICLGHQVLGLAIGATTSRLPFGHHGANHPVKELRTGRVTITSQNHNFQVDAASIPPESGFYVSHLNLSDGTVEGLAHDELPVLSVQYHPEACPGPEDNRYLFDQFAVLVTRERLALLAG
jgi:carbamoyl-phosphate synthase small subunit